MALSKHPRIVEMHADSTLFRKWRGREPQVLDEKLCVAAQTWANYMAAHNYFEHGGGEQIIMRGSRTARATFWAWYNSWAHRRWLLSENTQCGFGCQRAADGTMYWAGIFR